MFDIINITCVTLAGKLWTAPELLRMNLLPRRGTPKGDIYSMGIIFYEIMERTEPYNFDRMTPRGEGNCLLKFL